MWKLYDRRTGKSLPEKLASVFSLGEIKWTNLLPEDNVLKVEWLIILIRKNRACDSLINDVIEGWNILQCLCPQKKTLVLLKWEHNRFPKAYIYAKLKLSSLTILKAICLWPDDSQCAQYLPFGENGYHYN